MTKRNRNQYAVVGDVATLTTNSGQVILVDADDVDRLRDYTWCISGNGYAMSRTFGPAVILHRLVMDADPGMYVDHINGNILDNRKQNLRVCRKQENEFNQKLRADNVSGYRGVCRDKRRGGFRAYINKDGRQYHLGRFNDPRDAAEAYNRKAIELFGEFARLNDLRD